MPLWLPRLHLWFRSTRVRVSATPLALLSEALPSFPNGERREKRGAFPSSLEYMSMVVDQDAETERNVGRVLRQP
jgi:hypothetical protein